MQIVPVIGALIAEKWNFSLETYQLVLRHHDPLPSALEDELDEKLSIVQAANCMSHRLNYGHWETYPDLSEELQQALDLLEVAEDLAEAVFDETEELFAEQSALFG